jgi:type II secretory pathway component PulF
MVEVGEDSGHLPEMLGRGAESMEQSLERTLERLVRLAEPVMILVFGGIVGFIALALLRAIYGVHAEAF